MLLTSLFACFGLSTCRALEVVEVVVVGAIVLYVPFSILAVAKECICAFAHVHMNAVHLGTPGQTAKLTLTLTLRLL